MTNPTPTPSPIHRIETLRKQLLWWRGTYCSLGVVLGLALCVAAVANGWVLTGLLMLAGCVIAGWLYATKRFDRYEGQYYPNSGVCLLDGVWWRTEIWVPIARLQHLDVSQGPLDRHWGMATLSLHTAGAHEQVLKIKGLPLQEAHALRAALLPHLHHRHE